MKKTLIALAAVAATGAAFAQSSVTLYGIVDLGVVALKDTDSQGGVTSTTKKNAMKSVLNGSRFGLRGTEDLGGGLKGNFVLEYAVQPDEATTSMANRQAFVGVSGGFGEVRLGRQYTPFHNVQFAIDVAGNKDAPGYVLALHNRARSSNAINYSTPAMGGVTASVQYGFGEGNVNSGAVNPRKGDSLGANVVYSSGPLLVGFAYDRVNRPTTTAAAGVINFGGIASNASGSAIPSFAVFGTNTTKSLSTWALGGAYNFGVVRLTAGHSQLDDKGEAGVANVKSKGNYIGLSAPMGAVTLYAALGQAKVTEAGSTGEVKYRGHQLGANYALSKRTTAYASLGADKITETGVAGSLKRSQYGVGVRHTF